MKHYTLYCLNQKVQVSIYATQWTMHAASIKFKKNGSITDTTHDSVGKCYRWFINDQDGKLVHGKVVAVVMCSWDRLSLDVISHELLHAAIHCWGYETQENHYPREMNIENEEQLVYAHSDLLLSMVEMFTKKQRRRILSNDTASCPVS